MATHQPASYKRIVLCCDGTWLESDQGGNGSPSNVARLARAIASSGIDADNKVVKQIVYYHSGLGSGDLPLQKAIYGAVGWGLDRDVSQIYDFISNNYEHGDEIFLFGFSRGAYTVRSVAGLVCNVGILSAINMARFPEMWKEYMSNEKQPFKESTWYKDNEENLGLVHAKIKIVGVFDTVGSLGVPEWPVVKTARDWGVPINKRYQFHNTSVSKDIEYAFQALAIDEERLTFPPTLWYKTADGPSKELKQCWFPGVHSNIGGQAETDGSHSDSGQIGYVCLAWMMDCISNMLTFEEDSVKTFIQDHKHALNAIEIPNGWGCGPIIGNFEGLQGKFFALLGKTARTPGQYPGHAIEMTNEHFHPIVRVRKFKVPDYKPAALGEFQLEEPHGESGWKWTKKGVGSIPEYIMSAETKLSIAYMDEENTVTGYGSMESVSRLICPTDVLAWLK